MHFLVTGGTGLIGRNFIQSRPNDRFTVLTRNSQASINHSAVEWIHSLDKLTDLDFADGVINLAGEPLVGRRWSDVGKKSIKASRIETTRRLIELVASSQNPPQLFLSGSAIGVYGNAGDQACLESQSIALDSYDFPQSLCYEWESIASQCAELTRLTLLRTGIVLSTEGGALAKMLPAFRFGLGGPLGNGSQYMSWIHIQDMVAALNHIIATDSISGPVNLVAPNPVTNKIFTRCLGQSLSRPAVLPMPSCALKLLFGEASQLLLDSQNVVPSVLKSSGFQFSFTKIDDALKDLCAKD